MTLRNTLRIILLITIILGSAAGLLGLTLTTGSMEGFQREIYIQVLIGTQDVDNPSPAPACTTSSESESAGVRLAEWHDYED